MVEKQEERLVWRREDLLCSGCLVMTRSLGALTEYHIRSTCQRCPAALLSKLPQTSGLHAHTASILCLSFPQSLKPSRRAGLTLLDINKIQLWLLHLITIRVSLVMIFWGDPRFCLCGAEVWNRQMEKAGMQLPLHIFCYMCISPALNFIPTSPEYTVTPLHSRHVPGGISRSLWVMSKNLRIQSVLWGIWGVCIVWTVWYKVLFVQEEPQGLMHYFFKKGDLCSITMGLKGTCSCKQLVSSFQRCRHFVSL